MPSSIIDSVYYSDMFGTPAMRGVFSDERRFSTWLEVEAALARAEAKVGVIPQAAAVAISEAARLENLDVEAMRIEYGRVGFPILPLVHQLIAACDSESARWVHWGATTQDIVDTGLVLQMRDALVLIEAELDVVIGILGQLAREHRGTVMPGRTFQQHAAPITFGFKVAVWLDELKRHKERLPEMRRRALVCGFGGAVGTLATLGDDGIRVLAELSRELDLVEPLISWHTARDGWAEAVFWLALVGGSLGKIGTEVASLMRSEVDEVREPYVLGRGGSSTMPQKRNPVSSPFLIAISHRLRESVGSQLTAMIQDHERAVGAMPLEWIVIPEAFILTSGALHHARSVLEGITVNVSQMRANLDMGNGLLMAEAVMMGLAPKLGRGKAHQVVSDAAHRAKDTGLSLRQALQEDSLVMASISKADLDYLLDPSHYIGVSNQMIDRVLARV